MSNNNTTELKRKFINATNELIKLKTRLEENKKNFSKKFGSIPEELSEIEKKINDKQPEYEQHNGTLGLGDEKAESPHTLVEEEQLEEEEETIPDVSDTTSSNPQPQELWEDQYRKSGEYIEFMATIYNKKFVCKNKPENGYLQLTEKLRVPVEVIKRFDREDLLE